MDSQLFKVKNKTVFNFFFIVIIGFLLPILTAQKAVPIPEEQVQYLEDTNIARGTSSALKGLESKTFPKNPFAVGSDIDYIGDIDLYRRRKRSGLELIVNTRDQDWRNLNTGDGSRGSASLILFRF